MIQAIEIQGLRGIREGKLEELSPLTVLVGPNGCGKSTVLDALLIAANASPSDGLGRVVQRRSGLLQGARWLFWRGSDALRLIILVKVDAGTARSCQISPVRPAPAGGTVLVTSVIESQYGARQGLGTSTVNFRPGDGYQVEDGFYNPLEGVPDIRLVDSRVPELQTPLHQLFTQTVEQGRRKDARSTLAAVVPGLEDLQILTEGDAPIVYLEYGDYSVPAALAGDGVQVLLRLSLELAARPGGLVLLEEPEVHQHPGALRETARAILAAVRRGVQVVLTSHSLDLIDALLAATESREDLDKISVFRLKLAAGVLLSSRLAGERVAFARTEIEEDLR